MDRVLGTSQMSLPIPCLSQSWLCGQEGNHYPALGHLSYHFPEVTVLSSVGPITVPFKSLKGAWANISWENSCLHVLGRPTITWDNSRLHVLGRPRFSPLSPERTHVVHTLGFTGSRRSLHLSQSIILSPNAAFRLTSELKVLGPVSISILNSFNGFPRLYTIVWVLRKQWENERNVWILNFSLSRAWDSNQNVFFSSFQREGRVSLSVLYKLGMLLL